MREVRAALSAMRDPGGLGRGCGAMILSRSLDMEEISKPLHFLFQIKKMSSKYKNNLFRELLHETKCLGKTRTLRDGENPNDKYFQDLIYIQNKEVNFDEMSFFWHFSFNSCTCENSFQGTMTTLILY